MSDTLEFSFKSLSSLREVVRVTSAGEVIIKNDTTEEELKDVVKMLAKLISQHYIGVTLCQKDLKSEKSNPET